MPRSTGGVTRLGVVTTRLLTLTLTLPAGLVAGLLLTATPAAAAVPEGWSDPEQVSALEFLGIVVAAPVGLALLIALLVYLPSMVRGEGVAAGAGRGESQWFGGPTHGTAELAGPDGEGSEAGGAGVRW